MVCYYINVYVHIHRSWIEITTYIDIIKKQLSMNILVCESIMVN